MQVTEQGLFLKNTDLKVSFLKLFFWTCFIYMFHINVYVIWYNKYE